MHVLFNNRVASVVLAPASLALQGLGKMCMYCGDGINDLIALAAADVGAAIGAGDVSAAASFSTKQCSIAGISWSCMLAMYASAVPACIIIIIIIICVVRCCVATLSAPP